MPLKYTVITDKPWKYLLKIVKDKYMENNFLIVEKIDDKYGYLEDSSKNIVKVSLSLLPENIKCGDCIRIINGNYIFDKDLTEKRKVYAINLTKSLTK